MTQKWTHSDILDLQDDNDTEQAAAYWFATMLDKPVATEKQQEFERWYKHAEHAAAYKAFSQLWNDSEVALKQHEVVKPLPWYRRTTLQITSAAASVCIIALLWAMQQPIADYYTAPGEIRTVSLPDGTVATLSSDTRLALQYSNNERQLTLLSGEAWFQVSPDKQRPFKVTAKGGKSTALGTAFSVALQSAGAEVIVTEHSVEVTAGGQSEILTAGQAVRYHNNQLLTPDDIDTDVRLAWRNHQLVFLARPLGEVIEELNRWQPAKLILLGDELAQRQVTLILDIRQKDMLLQNLIQGLSLKSFSIGNQLTILYGS